MTHPIVTPDEPGRRPGEIRGPENVRPVRSWTPARASLARRLAGVTVALLIAFVLSLATPALARDTAAELRAFAFKLGIERVDEFVETVTSLRETRKLPARYCTKHEAETLGWKPGSDLCRVAKGRAIGGDTFHNREKRLPDGPGRRWREADLDYDCGRRGPKRLVWSSDGLIYVTVNHYATFREVPGP